MEIIFYEIESLQNPYIGWNSWITVPEHLTILEEYLDLFLLPEGFGKTKPDAAFSTEMYYSIINDRYDDELPWILTSSLTFGPWNDTGIGENRQPRISVA